MPQLKIAAQKFAPKIDLLPRNMPFLMYHNYLASYSKEELVYLGFFEISFFFFFFFFLTFRRI